MRHRRTPFTAIVILVLAGCSISVAPAQPAPTTPPVAPTPPAPAVVGSEVPPPQSEHPPAPTATTATTAPGDTGWLAAEPGVEVRRLRVPHQQMMASITVVRFDPALVQFRVGYTPAEPHMIAGWCALQEHENDVVAAFNGGFFNQDYQSTALVIHDGTASGTSYVGQGGMFAVDVNGGVSLRSLSEYPYDPNEPLVQALQGWPMLVHPGARPAYNDPADQNRARRSVLATDRAGRVLFLAFASSSFTLSELPPWLLASDMEIDAAVNLDGGSSTGLCLNAANQHEHIRAFSPLPLVLLVQRHN